MIISFPPEGKAYHLLAGAAKFLVATHSLGDLSGEFYIAARPAIYYLNGYEGRFIDGFYLGAGRTLLKSNGDELFVLEKDRDENFILIKYKIVG